VGPARRQAPAQVPSRIGPRAGTTRAAWSLRWGGTGANCSPRVGFIVTNLSLLPEGVIHFYNGRGTAEQWIKEGKYALNWTRLSCHRFVANAVRYARRIIFQMAEVAVSREVFAAVLKRIDRLRLASG
jgi:hypothetical protein